MLPSRFLIGIDSDGTAFDSMNQKHLEAFIPAALEVWPLKGDVARCFAETEKKVSLFSSTRGINRFPGLLEVFEQVEKAFPDDPSLPDLGPLREYVRESKHYSASSLKDWMFDHPSMELSRVLAWSIRSDVFIARACEGMLPYPGVKEALIEAGEKAAVAVVSAAVKEELEKSWAYGGLMPYVDLFMGQEDGLKPVQLNRAKAFCGGVDHALMIGDAKMDYTAAREAGVRFYPIVPGREAESWACFRQEVLPLFLSGQYGEAEEARYYEPLRVILESSKKEEGDNP